MYVCICYAVKDCDIRKAVAQGASSVEMVCDRLQVSTNCGRCLDHVHQVFAETLSQEQSPAEVTPLTRYYSEQRQAS